MKGAASSETEVARLQKRYFTERNFPQARKLPVNNYWHKIRKSIDDYPITIVVGSTGCGKTTQIPQLLLEDDLYQRGRQCNIVVTQPRVLAAISVAKTVCKDRNWELGSICGYQVGRERETSEDTRIQYVTTNVLVERIVHNKCIAQYTHVIIDEIHERSQDLDCLLYLLKTMRQKEEGLKIVLMSATAESSIYSDYFGDEICHLVCVEGSVYNVNKLYLEDLPSLISNQLLAFDAKYSEERTFSLRVEQLRIVADLILTFDETEPRGAKRGAVLIFVPGLSDVRSMIRILSDIKDSNKFELIPLHSKVPINEQVRAFQDVPSSVRKIIVATNVAESSITVPDIKHVIDFCLTKCQVQDTQTGFSAYKIENCSQASSEQRAGRAGRVQDGTVYRLVTKKKYQQFLEYSLPEIVRCPVDVSILKVKIFGLDNPKKVLQDFITPPEVVDVERAIIRLKEIQALQLEKDGVVNLEDGDLTIIGRVMAGLPLDIQLSKLILMGYAFGCFEECIKIAACLSVDDILTSIPSKMENYRNQLHWARSHFSDPIVSMNALEAYIEAQANLGGDFRSLAKWAELNFLQHRRLIDAYHVYEDLKIRLKNIGFVQPQSPNQKEREPSLQNFCLMIALCGAFYPYYYMQDPIEADKVLSNLSGHNPLSTMIISGLPIPYGPLYAQAIRSALKECIYGDVQLSFNDIDAFLQFTHNNTDGTKNTSQLPLEAYLCEMYMKIHRSLNVPKIPNEVADRLLKQLDITDENTNDTNRVVILPQSDETRLALPKPPLPKEKNFRGTISWFIDLLSFYLHLNEREDRMKIMENEINDEVQNNELVVVHDRKIGMTIFAKYHDRYYRARIVSINDTETVTVFFIDHGNTEDVEEVYEMPERMLICNTEAPFAYEAQLAHLQSPDGIVRKATEFERLREGQNCRIELLYIIDEVLRVDLFVEVDEAEVHVNNKLLREKLAVQMVEADFAPTITKNFESSTAHLVVRGEAFSNKLDYDAGTLSLYGPRSPLCSMFDLSALNKTQNFKTIKVMQGSINQILFGETGSHRRFIVSHAARLSHESTVLQLLRTTLMPKLPMMLPFVALVFCPRAEYRCNNERTQYVGAICGMGGVDSESQVIEPAYPQGDLEIPFSHEIGRREADLINHIRRLLNEAFCGNNEYFEWSSVPILRIQERIVEAMLKFFNNIKGQEIVHTKNERKPPSAYKWGKLPKNEQHENEMTKRQTLYRPHPTALIRNAQMVELLSLYTDFLETAKPHNSVNLSFCPLCQKLFERKVDAYNHLTDQTHMLKVKKLKGEPLDEEDD